MICGSCTEAAHDRCRDILARHNPDNPDCLWGVLVELEYPHASSRCTCPTAASANHCDCQHRMVTVQLPA